MFGQRTKVLSSSVHINSVVLMREYRLKVNLNWHYKGCEIVRLHLNIFWIDWCIRRSYIFRRFTFFSWLLKTNLISNNTFNLTILSYRGSRSSLKMLCTISLVKINIFHNINMGPKWVLFRFVCLYSCDFLVSIHSWKPIYTTEIKFLANFNGGNTFLGIKINLISSKPVAKWKSL